MRVLLASGLLAMTLGASPTDAAEVTVSPGFGATSFDQQLDHYRWDLGPHPTWGLEVRMSHGRLSTGLRATRSSTTQSTGIPGDSPRPSVRLTSTTALVETQIARTFGIETFLLGQGGRIHLGYDPDRLVLDTGSGLVEVRYAPIDEWTAGLGLGIRRGLTRGASVGVSAERSWFALDTAHRAGDTIVQQRETFGTWSLRASIGWTFGD